MTPKEKAEDLFYKMSYNSSDEDHHCSHYVAKNCTLIAVDVILNDIMLWWYAPTEDMPKDIFYFVTQKNYWKEVKQEIEKL